MLGRFAAALLRAIVHRQSKTSLRATDISEEVLTRYQANTVRVSRKSLFRVTNESWGMMKECTGLAQTPVR